MGKLSLFARKYLLPQWKVLACEEGTIIGIIIAQHYSETLAVLHAERLNQQRPGNRIYTGDNPVRLYFKAQKNTCF